MSALPTEADKKAICALFQLADAPVGRPNFGDGPKADNLASLIHQRERTASSDRLLKSGEKFGQPFDQVCKMVAGELNTGR